MALELDCTNSMDMPKLTEYTNELLMTKAVGEPVIPLTDAMMAGATRVLCDGLGIVEGGGLSVMAGTPVVQVLNEVVIALMLAGEKVEYVTPWVLLEMLQCSMVGKAGLDASKVATRTEVDEATRGVGQDELLPAVYKLLGESARRARGA